MAREACLRNLTEQVVDQDELTSEVRLQAVPVDWLLAAQNRSIFRSAFTSTKLTQSKLSPSPQVHPGSNVELQKNLDSWHSHTAYGLAVRG